MKFTFLLSLAGALAAVSSRGQPLAHGTEWDAKVTDDRFPGQSLLAKDPKSLGLDTVTQYAGYFEPSQGKHLFFWFFEARNDPENAPVLLWLNGGPGCSSLEGLLFENGPATVAHSDQPQPNPYSWNTNANVIYLDQPVNVGYSYDDNSSEDVGTSAKAASDTYAFLELFFKQYPQYAKKPLHVSGESYGGHYIPDIGAEILSHDDASFKLGSLLIGNGLTDPLTQYSYYEPMACGEGGVDAVLDQDTCSSMKEDTPDCLAKIKQCYQDPSDTDACEDAENTCDNALLGPFQQSGLNVYDVTKKCEGNNGLCYTQLDDVTSFFQRSDVKSALGAPAQLKFESCNNEVHNEFTSAGDWMQPIQLQIPKVLEAGVPVLIYAGDYDFICNWLGNEAWTKALPWSGHEQFAAADYKPWTLDGKQVGAVRNYKGFTFARVHAAGHMVPYDQPAAALDMVNKWLSGDHTLGSSS